MELTTQSHQNTDPQRWDEFVEKQSLAWMWQTALACGMHELWHGKTNLSFCVLHQQRIVAVFPLSLITRKKLGLKVCWLESLGGPLVERSLPPKTQKKIRKFIDAQIRQLEAKYHTWQTQVLVSPLQSALGGQRVNPILEYSGFKNHDGQSWVIDLQRAPGQSLFEAYLPTTRNEIRKIQASDHQVREACSSDLETYYQLHQSTYLRNGIPPHPKAYFKYIFDEFLPRGWARILFLEKHGKVTTAHNMALFNQAAYYWTGASSEQKESGESKYLTHLQIQYAQEKGYLYFEVGEAFPWSTEGKKKGLNDFKKCFGGDLYPFFKARRNSPTFHHRLAIGVLDFLREGP